MNTTENRAPTPFVAAMTEYILDASNLPRKEEVAQSLKESLTALEESLADGGLCAKIKETDAALLTGNGLAYSYKGSLEENLPPLILADGENLYLNRDFAVELTLAKCVHDFAIQSQKATQRHPIADISEIEKDPDRKRAIELALTKPFVVIYGGPGTGKTSSLALILELLLEENPRQKIYLGAPTGKAAARMREALETSATDERPHLREKLGKKDNDGIPARTLHKWLYTPQETGERPSKDSPLLCDVFVLDEASMLDARLAATLLDVLDKKRTKVIFLGDAYQLQSVGPGSVFADLCELGRAYGFASELKKSFRFDPLSGIGKMAAAINTLARKKSNDSPARTSEAAERTPEAQPNPIALNLLQTEEVSCYVGSLVSALGLETKEDVAIKITQEEVLNELPSEFVHWLESHIREYAKALATRDEDKLWDAAQSFRVLCATRKGRNSVDAVNRYATNALKEALTQYGFEKTTRAGEILIVTKNDDTVGLYNGDIGVVLPADSRGVVRVLFSGASQERRRIALSRLPEYETAFGITIHKSQGSEYEDVALLLPTRGATALLTNELLYTAVTRVKDIKDKDFRITRYGKLSIFASPEALQGALSSCSERKTGLKNRLREAFEGAI